VQRGPCHLEYRGGIEDYCRAAARRLEPGARFVTCAAVAQVTRVGCAAATAGLAVERRLDVVPREGKAPLFSVYALAGGTGTAPAVVTPPLVVRDAAGQWTAAFRALREEMGLPP
jgi:tRNA1(Val) A37 N6-methylase TrmN6